MDYIQEKAHFALKSGDISLSDTFGDYPVTNLAGTNNATRTITTWYSVNFENILGDLYNRFELFNLKVKFFTFNSTAAYGVTSNDRSITFQMTGLNWIGSNYDVVRGCNTNSATFYLQLFTANTAATAAGVSEFVITFQKQKTANITISMLNALFVEPALNANTQMPRYAFYFDITPLYTGIPTTISLASAKCASLNVYYLAGTTNTVNMDMYAILGRENFQLGAKYNLVLKMTNVATWAAADATISASAFNVFSSGMRFQNYETSIGKVGGNPMQLVSYCSVPALLGAAANPRTIRYNLAGLNTFILESQICDLTIRLQNSINNTEYAVATSNTLLCFDIWKCVV